MAALSVPQEALIQHNPGDSRDPKSIQYPTACHLTLQEEGQFSCWNRTSTATTSRAQLLALLDEIHAAHLCLSCWGVGTAEGPSETAAFVLGRVQLPGCCAALPCLMVGRSPQRAVVFYLSFLGGPFLHLMQRIGLVPPESRHGPQVIFLLKHSRKARGL